jgi:hypothetical protein
MDCLQQRDRIKQNYYYEVNMTQATDTDIREIKTAIESNTKAIADLVTSVSGLREEMRVGFTEIKGEFREVKEKIEGINGRLVAVENNVKGLDARLWGFGGTLLGAVLAALLAIFGRFLFANTPLG